MSKQTAVEWLYERLERMIPRTALYNIDKKQYFKQAKEMEKEQIIDAHIAGMEFIAVDPKHYLDDANNYYNSEYKGGEQ